MSHQKWGRRKDTNRAYPKGYVPTAHANIVVVHPPTQQKSDLHSGKNCPIRFTPSQRNEMFNMVMKTGLTLDEYGLEFRGSPDAPKIMGRREGHGEEVNLKHHSYESDWLGCFHTHPYVPGYPVLPSLDDRLLAERHKDKFICVGGIEGVHFHDRVRAPVDTSPKKPEMVIRCWVSPKYALNTLGGSSYESMMYYEWREEIPSGFKFKASNRRVHDWDITSSYDFYKGLDR